MSYPVFPNIRKPSYPFLEKLEDPAIRSTMENGMVVSRPRFTRNRKTFTLSWNNMPNPDYVILRNFYTNIVYGGSAVFTWTYPKVPGDDYSEQQFLVRFVGDAPNFSLITFNSRQGSITLQEV